MLFLLLFVIKIDTFVYILIIEIMNPIYTHKSIRKFKSAHLEKAQIEKMVEAATRGSNTGNMQLYSIVLTTDTAIREQLAPCHYNQPCVKSAPLIVTFCADINRFSLWCKERNAEPAYDNFCWFTAATVDTMIAAQNFTLEAEAQGLGICYLGTTIYNAKEICSILKLPKGVIPITTIVVGEPDENPELTERLPIEAVAHWQTYSDYTPEKIDELWSEKESLELTKKLVEDNGTENLAQIFTTKRYKREDNLAISKKYFDTLKEQGFFNNQD